MNFPCRRALFLLLLLVLIAGSEKLVLAASFSPAMIRDVSRAVKMLVTEGNGSRIGQGTGFFVTKDGLMLTNYHVVEGNRTVKIWDGDTLYDIVRIVAFDKDADVALLETAYPRARVRHLPLRTDVAELGEPVMVLGYPRAFQLGDSITVTKGDVSSIRRTGTDTLLQFTAFVAGGSSGSPVIDEKGRAAGIVTSELTLGQGMFLGLSSPSILRHLAMHLPKEVEEVLVEIPPASPFPPVPPPSPAPRIEVPSAREKLVREVQHLLNELGYDAGPVDGKAGPRTASAVGKFQRSRGVARNGQVSEALLRMLQNEKKKAEAAKAAAVAREIENLKENALRGNAEAQRELGLIYKDGLRVQRNYPEAAGWLLMASLQGDPVAQNSLAPMYRFGLGVPRDLAAAAIWYSRAAVQGYAPAQYHLAGLFMNALGVPMDRTRAFAWYLRAAEQGYAPAQYALGGMYERGDGTPADREKAVQWYGKAEALGETDARNALERLLRR